MITESLMELSIHYYFKENSCHKIRFIQTNQQGNSPLTFKNFFDLITIENSPLLDLFIDTIHNFPSQALFFETPPITSSTYNTLPFEYVLLPSPELELITMNYSPFEEKFKHSCHTNIKLNHNNTDFVTFSNLSGESRLISPCPIYTHTSSLITSTNTPYIPTNDITNNVIDFSHFSKFIYNAPNKDIIRNLFITLKIEIEHIFSSQSGHNSDPHNSDHRLWISTSGLGVSWLHIRLDSIPKYYNYKEYT